MSASSLLPVRVFVAVVAVLLKPLGGHRTCVFGGEKTFPDRLLRPLEHWIHRVTVLMPTWRDELDTIFYRRLSFLPALTLGPIPEHLIGR